MGFARHFGSLPDTPSSSSPCRPSRPATVRKQSARRPSETVSAHRRSATRVGKCAGHTPYPANINARRRPAQTSPGTSCPASTCWCGSPRLRRHDHFCKMTIRGCRNLYQVRSGRPGWRSDRRVRVGPRTAGQRRSMLWPGSSASIPVPVSTIADRGNRLATPEPKAARSGQRRPITKSACELGFHRSSTTTHRRPTALRRRWRRFESYRGRHANFAADLGFCL